MGKQAKLTGKNIGYGARDRASFKTDGSWQWFCAERRKKCAKQPIYYAIGAESCAKSGQTCALQAIYCAKGYFVEAEIRLWNPGVHHNEKAVESFSAAFGT